MLARPSQSAELYRRMHAREYLRTDEERAARRDLKRAVQARRPSRGQRTHAL